MPGTTLSTSHRLAGLISEQLSEVCTAIYPHFIDGEAEAGPNSLLKDLSLLVSPKIRRLESSPPMPQNVTVFVDRVITEVIK
jgi:hypothetical protein